MTLHPEYLHNYFPYLSHQALEPVFAQVPPGIRLTGGNGYAMGTQEQRPGLLNTVTTDHANQLSYHHINQTLLNPHNSGVRSQSHSPMDQPLLLQEKDRIHSRRKYEQSLQHRRLQSHDMRHAQLAGGDGDPIPSMYFEPTEHKQQFLSSVNLDRMYGEQFVPGTVPTYEAPYLSTAAKDISSTAFDLPASHLGISSHGVQNVPMMSTIGMQYMNDSAANIPHANSLAPIQGASLPGCQPIPFGRFGQSENGRPLVVTGDVCPLCGKPDYHTHSGAATMLQHAGNVNHRGFKEPLLSNPVLPSALGLSNGIAQNAGGVNYVYQRTAFPTTAVK